MPIANKAHERGVLGTCSAAHFLHDGFSDVLYLLFPIWQAEFSLSLTQVGLLKGAFSTAMASSQVPAGFLAERWGERGLLTAGTAMAALGLGLLGLTDGFTELALCLIVLGVGSSVQHPLCSSLVSNAYDGGRRRAALGIYNFAGDLGKFAFPGLGAVVIASTHWSTATTGLAGIGLMVAVGILVLLMHLGAGGRHDAPDSGTIPGTMPDGNADWGIRNKGGFFTLSAIGMIDMATRTAFLTFLPFLLIDKGASVQTLGIALSLVFAGGATGKLLCGVLAERFGIFRVIILTELLTASGIILLLLLPLGGCLLLLPVIGVALNGTSSVLYGTVAEFVTMQRRARAFALFYTLGTIAGALSPPIYGALSDAAGVPITLAVLSTVLLTTVPLAQILRISLRRNESITL